MTSPNPQQIQVDPDRVIAILCSEPIGKALFERAQWQAAYEESAAAAQRFAGDLQTARQALDAATATPPGLDEQASTPAGT